MRNALAFYWEGEELGRVHVLLIGTQVLTHFDVHVITTSRDVIEKDGGDPVQTSLRWVPPFPSC